MLSKRGITTAIILLVLALVPGLAYPITPVEAVSIQVEHEYASGRIEDEIHEDLLQSLADAESAFRERDAEAYRSSVKAFKDFVKANAGNEIDHDAAQRILSVAKSL